MDIDLRGLLAFGILIGLAIAGLIWGAVVLVQHIHLSWH